MMLLLSGSAVNGKEEGLNPPPEAPLMIDERFRLKN
jgi:hypothetical protein